MGRRQRESERTRQGCIRQQSASCGSYASVGVVVSIRAVERQMTAGWQWQMLKDVDGIQE